MRTGILFASSIALALGTIVPGCTSSSTQESTGEYIDDATITSRVKAAVLGEPSLSTLQIGVETYKDVVQLSGFVDSAQEKNRAGALALAVPGVKSVRNNLLVK
jgi:hyperosmotically inducible periplasmic protein